MDALDDVLERARARGLLGPGPVERQREHAEDLARAIGAWSGEFLDLGSGGGLPGLVLLHEWPDARAVLLDVQQRRCALLAEALRRLGWEDRAMVACGRAEQLARRPDLRSHFELVVARGFGPPAVTAECGVGFLRTEGRLVVTEPPDGIPRRERWNAEGLAALGFAPPAQLRVGETGAVSLVLTAPVEDRWPRRDGVPGKRPLW